jgi:hypothetical protein
LILKNLTHIIDSLVVERMSVVGSVDEEEAEEHNDGHGEENSTIEHIFTQTKCANQLQINIF